VLIDDKLKRTVLCFALMSIVAVTPSPSIAVPVAHHANDVSLVALIVNPSAYDGKLVRVTGFAVFEFETTALYLSKQDAALGLDENSVMLDTRRPLDELQPLHGHYVFVSGTFEANDDLRAGRIVSIQVLQPVRPIRNFDDPSCSQSLQRPSRAQSSIGR